MYSSLCCSVPISSGYAPPTAGGLSRPRPHEFAGGAEVVKVEHPQRGDETRQWGPPFVDGEGAIFLAANAGKRSLALNFHEDAGKEVLYRLADRAEVVVQSLRPGHAGNIGFGAEELRARNP